MKSLLTLAVCLLAPTIAAAEPNYDSEPGSENQLEGLIISFDLGYMVPMGDMLVNRSAYTTIVMDHLFSAGIPVGIGLGYRPSPLVSFGLNFQYAPMLWHDCDTGTSCSARETFFGASLRFHGAAHTAFSPTLSLGIGYEWLSFSAGDGGLYYGALPSGDLGVSGVLFDFQFGGDIRVSRSLTVGHSVTVRFGSYGTASRNGKSGDIPDSDQTMHGWIGFGLRGTFTVDIVPRR